MCLRKCEVALNLNNVSSNFHHIVTVSKEFYNTEFCSWLADLELIEIYTCWRLLGTPIKNGPNLKPIVAVSTYITALYFT